MSSGQVPGCGGHDGVHELRCGPLLQARCVGAAAVRCRPLHQRDRPHGAGAVLRLHARFGVCVNACGFLLQRTSPSHCPPLGRCRSNDRPSRRRRRLQRPQQQQQQQQQPDPDLSCSPGPQAAAGRGRSPLQQTGGASACRCSHAPRSCTCLALAGLPSRRSENGQQACHSHRTKRTCQRTRPQLGE